MLSIILLLSTMIIQSQSPLLTSEEWVAEGWDITDRVTYNISDYVEPYSINENGIAEYFVELCFTEEGEFRAAIAGENEVVFFSDVGLRHSVIIPEYRNISLSPNNFLAVVSDYGNNQYLIDGIDESVSQLDITAFHFDWFINNNSQITGIGRNSITFCNRGGDIVRIQDYQNSGRPTFVQWGNASEGNLIIVINGIEYLIEAYSISGGLHWSFDFLYASAGTVPLAVSADGSCSAVSQSSNGFIVLNAGGEIFAHCLENYYVLSLVVSPEGNYIAATVAARDEHSNLKLPELYLFDVQNNLLKRIEFDSRHWLPSVCSIAADGSLLCGFNHNDGEYGNLIRGRRYVLYDISGAIIWESSTSITEDIVINSIMRYMPYGISNKGFVNSVMCTDVGYQLCYMDPINGEIVSFHIMNN